MKIDWFWLKRSLLIAAAFIAVILALDAMEILISAPIYRYIRYVILIGLGILILIALYPPGRRKEED